MLPFLDTNDILCVAPQRGRCSVIYTEKYEQGYTERTKYPAGTKTLQVFPTHPPLPLKQRSRVSVPKGFSTHRASTTLHTKMGTRSSFFRAQISNTSLLFLKSHSTHLLARASPKYSPWNKLITPDTKKQHTWQQASGKTVRWGKYLTEKTFITQKGPEKLKPFIP